MESAHNRLRRTAENEEVGYRSGDTISRRPRGVGSSARMSAPTTEREASDAAVETPTRTQSRPPPAGPPPARVGVDVGSEERPEHRVRHWLGTAGSARSRILIWYVVLLALAAALGLLGFRQALLLRLNDQVDDALGQEVQELNELLGPDGLDPDTGEAFASLREVFDTYFKRNVPSRDEGFIGFVEGEQYRAVRHERFPLDAMPRRAVRYGEELGSRARGPARLATGRIKTEIGDAHYRALRIEFKDDVGAFLVMILPAQEKEEIGDLVTYGGAATLAVLLLASSLAWLIAGRVLKPVGALTDTARSISQSDLTHRIDVRGGGEAAEMARSFNAMLDRLEAVFRNQREFVRDANHELRDPLTIIRGHLELMSDENEDPEDRKRTIGIVLDEVDRIGRIVGDLQLLAEAGQPGFLDLEWIDLDVLAQELVSKATALAARRWELEEAGEGTLFADRHRLTEAVMNLAHNAVQHTEPDDTIAIGVSTNDDWVRLRVRDTGTGISVSDQATIFNRFTRGTGSHRRYPGGGLGLAIVKAVAEAHGGSVELESRLGEGSTFTIVVPRQANEGVAEWPES
jgi:signal transduction histidine kinase